MSDITMEVKKDFGNFGGIKKLTLTSWNGNEAKYDIRDWYENGNCGKGIGLTKDELKSLYDMLSNIYNKKDLDDLWNEPTEENVEEITEESTLFDELFEETDKSTEIFNKLDDLFKGFTTNKTYDVMTFAEESGKRIQYFVKKGRKKLPSYDKVVEELGLKVFVTEKGNLFIYSLGEI